MCSSGNDWSSARRGLLRAKKGKLPLASVVSETACQSNGGWLLTNGTLVLNRRRSADGAQSAGGGGSGSPRETKEKEKSGLPKKPPEHHTDAARGRREGGWSSVHRRIALFSANVEVCSVLKGSAVATVVTEDSVIIL